MLETGSDAHVPPSTAPVQVKELTFSHGIAAHDLATKVKQIESWLEKNNHIRVTLRARRGHPAHNLVRSHSAWDPPPQRNQSLIISLHHPRLL